MTAFKGIPGLDDFLKGLESKMLKTRKVFDKHVEQLHRATLKEHSKMKTDAEEQQAHEEWTAKKSREKKPMQPHIADGRPLVCEACCRM